MQQIAELLAGRKTIVIHLVQRIPIDPVQEQVHPSADRPVRVNRGRQEAVSLEQAIEECFRVEIHPVAKSIRIGSDFEAVNILRRANAAHERAAARTDLGWLRKSETVHSLNLVENRIND
jgi:hypothetical protein